MHQEIAQRLKDAMKAEGVSVTELAVVMGVSTGRVSQLRNGEPMTQGQIISACLYLKISPTWLLLGIGPMELVGLPNIFDFEA